jgi:cysteine desulfurase family protein (TIGR01976 family)
VTATAAPTSRTASVEEIRAQFPALARTHLGMPVAYFDGPGGTQVPTIVTDAVTEYLLHHNANTHWLYPTSEETDAMITRSREALADLFNAAPEEIAFGQNMTMLAFHLSRALGRGWGPGDEIVITELDHHSNVAPWRALERERGVTIRTVPMNVDTGRIEWRELERAMTGKTRLLAIGGASNALGTITDVRAATALAHAAGAQVFVDAVHLVPHALIDVRAIDCDWLACSAYKFYGPHVGALYGKRAAIEALDVPKLDPAPDYAPERIETGTLNHEGIVGAGAAVDFLASIGGNAGTRRESLRRAYDELHRRGEVLVARLWAGLEEIDGVRLFGPRPGTPRTPTVAFVVRGTTTNDIAIELAKRALFTSNGDFYAATVIERLGQAPDGVVRAGCSCYTTEAEVDRFVAAIREIAGRH